MLKIEISSVSPWEDT